jgi:hypothetical protein
MQSVIQTADFQPKRLDLVSSKPICGQRRRERGLRAGSGPRRLLRGESPIASHLLYTQPGILKDDVPEERPLGIEAGLAWRSVGRRLTYNPTH